MNELRLPPDTPIQYEEGSYEVMQEFIHDRHAMEWIDD